MVKPGLREELIERLLLLIGGRFELAFTILGDFICSFFCFGCRELPLIYQLPQGFFRFFLGQRGRPILVRTAFLIRSIIMPVTLVEE